MARLVLVLLLALALLPSPGRATVVPMSDCVMMQDGMPMPPDGHDDGCCTDECVMVPGAVALPPLAAGTPMSDVADSSHWSSAFPALPSSNPAADDPPPRS